MTMGRCKKCGKTIITTNHIEDKKEMLCNQCSKKREGYCFNHKSPIRLDKKGKCELCDKTSG